MCFFSLIFCGHHMRLYCLHVYCWGEDSTKQQRERETRASESEKMLMGERVPIWPLGPAIYRMGGGRQFSPGPLVGTIFTNRSLGRYMRPINLMGWAIPPTYTTGDFTPANREKREGWCELWRVKMRGMGAHKRREQVRSAQVSPLLMTPWVLYI